MSPVLPLRGRRALVTGAGRGIGLAIARRLASDGARLVLLGRDPAALEAAAFEISRTLPADWQVDWPVDWLVERAAVDVTDAEALAAALGRLGDIDILVNNAGAALSRRFLDHSPADWHAMLAVNLTGAFLASRQVLPGMLRRGWGRIVSVASTAGLRGYPYAAAYGAAKHGLIGLTRSLALEVAAQGVTVNAVCPGFTETALLEDAVETVSAGTGRSASSARATLMRYNPQGRFVLPEEVAEAVAFLCRDGAGAVTGQALSISGGEVMA